MYLVLPPPLTSININKYSKLVAAEVITFSSSITPSDRKLTLLGCLLGPSLYPPPIPFPHSTLFVSAYAFPCYRLHVSLRLSSSPNSSLPESSLKLADLGGPADGRSTVLGRPWARVLRHGAAHLPSLTSEKDHLSKKSNVILLRNK